MRISRATARQAKQLEQVITTSPLLRRYGMTKARARRAVNEALRERDLLLVARERDQLLGLAWVVVSRVLDRSAYLRLLLVAEGAQSRGIGAALLAEAERRSRVAGAQHFVFLVTADNRRARTFYERHGYARLSTLRGFVRPKIDETLYLKNLGRSRR